MLLPLGVDYVSLLILPCMTAFPPEALSSFISTMQSSDCLQPVCLPPLVRLSGIPLIHWACRADMEAAGSPLLTRRHCTTWLTLDPAVPMTGSPNRKYHRVAFQGLKIVGALFTKDFEAVMPSVPAALLSTLSW